MQCSPIPLCLSYLVPGLHTYNLWPERAACTWTCINPLFVFPLPNWTISYIHTYSPMIPEMTCTYGAWSVECYPWDTATLFVPTRKKICYLLSWYRLDAVVELHPALRLTHLHQPRLSILQPIWDSSDPMWTRELRSKIFFSPLCENHFSSAGLLGSTTDCSTASRLLWNAYYSSFGVLSRPWCS